MKNNYYCNIFISSQRLCLISQERISFWRMVKSEKFNVSDTNIVGSRVCNIYIYVYIYILVYMLSWLYCQYVKFVNESKNVGVQVTFLTDRGSCKAVGRAIPHVSLTSGNSGRVIYKRFPLPNCGLNTRSQRKLVTWNWPY